jgi:signal transduction histidine kinase
MPSSVNILESSGLLESRSNGKVYGNASNAALLEEQTSGRHETDQELQATTQQRERLVALGTSAVVLAHEIANPIQIMTGTLELIATEFRTKELGDSALMDMIKGAAREGHRLGKLLRVFQHLARPEYLDLRLTDLAEILTGILAQQKLQWQAAGVAVTLHCETPLPCIKLDADKITQVILNLCKNAVDAMPNGGCLSIRVYPSESMIVMEIADTGIGIPGNLDVFELFKTTKPGGTGLGLPIVRRIISTHKGTINYVTELDRGTTFTVKLPAETHN